MANIKSQDQLWKDVEKCMNYINSRDIQYGYPVRRKHQGSGLTVAEIARRQEDGVMRADGSGWKIPPRKFMTKAFELAQVGNFDYGIIDSVFAGSIRRTQTNFRLVGQRLADAIREAIVYGQYAPLSRETVRRKGHSTPLLDTEQMYNDATFKIAKTAGVI